MKQEDSRDSPITSMNEYSQLPILKDIVAAAKTPGWTVPGEFFVACTDVRNSTEALEEGHYKHVNVAGALGIMAIARVYQTLDLPFSFGGDGMFCLVDRERVSAVKEALGKLVRDVDEFFGLDLRGALIPVEALYARGVSLGVSKYRVSPTYTQAVFHGRGLVVADQLLKSPGLEESGWNISPDTGTEPGDYQGFSCRWQDIPSKKDFTCAVIVEPRGFYSGEMILQAIWDIFGGAEGYHPIQVPDEMKMGGPKSSWKLEARLTGRFRRGLGYLLGLFRTRLLMAFVGMVRVLRIPLRVGLYEVHNVAQQNREASDFQKLDGSLKIILSADRQELDALERVLEAEYRNGNCYYGIHTTHSAHMTCLASLDSGHDIHFLDATDGGYTFAAKKLKQQRREPQELPDGQSSFFSALAPHYETIFSLGRDTLSFVQGILDESPGVGEDGAPLGFLDIGCATGELLRTVAKNRPDRFCVGFDYDPKMVQQAESAVSDLGLPLSRVRVYRGDFTASASYSIARQQGRYALITCLGNTLIHSRNKETLGEVLRTWRSMLAAEGYLLIQLLNYDMLRRTRGEDFPPIHAGNLTFLRRYEYPNTGDILFHTKLIDEQGGVHTNRERIYSIDPPTLGKALRNAGYQDIQWFSGFSSSPLERDDPVVVCLVRV